jgi:hypothetical protein
MTLKQFEEKYDRVCCLSRGGLVSYARNQLRVLEAQWRRCNGPYLPLPYHLVGKDGTAVQECADRAMFFRVETEFPEQAMEFYSRQAPSQIRSLEQCLVDWHNHIERARLHHV